MDSKEYYEVDWPEVDTIDMKNIKNRYKEIEPKKNDIQLENFLINYIATDENLRGSEYRNSIIFKRNKNELHSSIKFNIRNYNKNNLNNGISNNNNLNENDILKTFLRKLESNQTIKAKRSSVVKFPIINSKPRHRTHIKNSSSNEMSRNYNIDELSEFKLSRDNDINEKNILDENNNNIFKVTNCGIRTMKDHNFNSIDTTNSKENEKEKKTKTKIHCFSPLLGKSLKKMFVTVNDKEENSIKKGRIIKDGVKEMCRNGIDIDKYDINKKYGYNCSPVKIKQKNYNVINIFTDFRKLKSVKDIDDILFRKNKEFFPYKKYENKLYKQSIKRFLNLEENLKK